jgi:hypothetical protein
VEDGAAVVVVPVVHGGESLAGNGAASRASAE